MALENDKLTNRRDFLKGSFAVAFGLNFPESINTMFPGEKVSSPSEARKGGGMPKRRLGKTEGMVSMLCVGGYHIGRMKDEHYAIRMIHAALDEGVNFFDSAWSYNDGDSEIRLGKALKDRRDRAFIMTKTRARDSVTASKELHESLRRLQTDCLDLWQFHDLQTMEDVESIFNKGGAIEVAIKAKKECLYYAWSQSISTLVSGMDSMEQLKENVSYAQQFEKLSGKDQSMLLARTEPFCGIKTEFYKHPSQKWRIYPAKPRY